MSPGWLLAAASLSSGPSTNLLSTNKEPSILRPPLPPVPPGFWETNGTWILAAAGFLVIGIVALVVWRLRRPAVLNLVAPIHQANQRLQRLEREPETGAHLSAVSRILRVYLVKEFQLDREELTTREFVLALRRRPEFQAGLAATIEGFLTRCDERKFSLEKEATPLSAAQTAMRIIAEAQAVSSASKAKAQASADRTQ